MKLTPLDEARIIYALRDDPPIHNCPRDWQRLPLTGPLAEIAQPAPRQPWETES